MGNGGKEMNKKSKGEKKVCPICNGSGDVSSFGIEVAKRRSALGLGRYQLAAKCGISNVTIGNVERGDTSPRITTMKAIDEALTLLEVEGRSGSGFTDT
jgi:ribosome-binding protein aMBF1 (putative translation factor)